MIKRTCFSIKWGIMKEEKKFFDKIKADFKRIHLVDKYLIVFMMILLLQSAYCLFMQGGLSKEAGNVDIIVRTSAAGIFGYFLSANFINRSVGKDTGKRIDSSAKSTQERKAADPGDGGENTIKNKMGFAIPSSADSSEEGKAEVLSVEEEEPEELTGQLQIVIAATIGLFCLLVLIFMRNMVGDDLLLGSTSSSTATVAQFRDFVSGCVGFLIGCPTSVQKK